MRQIQSKPILMKLLQATNLFFASKKMRTIYIACKDDIETITYSIGDSEPKSIHPPTTDLWPTGNGQVPHPHIKISSWNVNGFRSILRKGNLAEFMAMYQPDFMCLSETKICYNKFRELNGAHQNPFPEYDGYWNFCKIKGGYSGVSIFAKYRPIKVIEDFPNYPACSLEGRVITLEYEKFFLLNAYNPTSQLDLQRLAYRTLQFDRSFNQHVKGLSSRKPVIVVGDMNVAHQQIDAQNSAGKERWPGFTLEQRLNFNDLLKENQLIDTYRHIYPKGRKYSWWDYRTRSKGPSDRCRLDYILADHRLGIVQADIHTQVIGSDHFPVSALIKLQDEIKQQ